MKRAFLSNQLFVVAAAFLARWEKWRKFLWKIDFTGPFVSMCYIFVTMKRFPTRFGRGNVFRKNRIHTEWFGQLWKNYFWTYSAKIYSKSEQMHEKISQSFIKNQTYFCVSFHFHTLLSLFLAKVKYRRFHGLKIKSWNETYKFWYKVLGK